MTENHATSSSSFPVRVRDTIKKYKIDAKVDVSYAKQHRFGNIVSLTLPAVKEFESRRQARDMARAIHELDLSHVKIGTHGVCQKDESVLHLSRTIREIKKTRPYTFIEADLPRLEFANQSLRKVLDSRPDVVSHDLKAVRRLVPLFGGRVYDYDSSLSLIGNIKRMSPGTTTKSSLALGAGENWGEVFGTMRHLRKKGLDILSLKQHVPLAENQPPAIELVGAERFELYERMAYQLGFSHVISEPLTSRR